MHFCRGGIHFDVVGDGVEAFTCFVFSLGFTLLSAVADAARLVQLIARKDSVSHVTY